MQYYRVYTALYTMPGPFFVFANTRINACAGRSCVVADTVSWKHPRPTTQLYKNNSTAGNHANIGN